jgi:hypothetical protein
MLITYQTIVVRTPRYTILVDTCTGEDKDHPPFDFPGKERWRNELFALGISSASSGSPTDTYAERTSERKRLTCPARSFDCEDNCSAAPST